MREDGGIVFSGLRLPSRWRSPKELDPPLWGDGLVDQSLTTLWYPSNWNDTSSDELIFLIPSLIGEARGGPGAPACGVSSFLRRALCARLRWVSLRLCPSDRGAGGPKQLLNAVSATRAITALDCSQAWIEGVEPFRALYSPRLRQRLENHHEGHAAFRAHEAWIHELSILKCLDQCLQDVLRPSGIADQKQSIDVEFGLADALIASTYASVNAAYIYPGFMTFHELFTVGAWLGHLLRGRPALMPMPVAEYLIEQSQRKPTEPGCEGLQCDNLVRFHMGLVGGAKTLVRTAGRVRANGYSGIVHPRGDSASLERSHYVWNTALREYFNAHLPQVSG
jgi:hypothetical protein